MVYTPTRARKIQMAWNKVALRTKWLPVFKRTYDELDSYETGSYAGVYGYDRDSPYYCKDGKHWGSGNN